MDGDALQVVDLIRHTDVVWPRIHWTVHYWRNDWTLSCRFGRRRSFDGHLLCRCALPLHHGRWRANGLSRRTSLLVAKDQRSYVSRRLGTIQCACDLRGIQSDISAAVRRRLHGNAAQVPRVSAGVSGVQCAVVSGSVHSGIWNVDTGNLLCLVDALRQTCGSESVALTWFGMANAITAANRKFRTNTDRHVGSL